MTRKNLYNWYNSNDISYNEKSTLNKLGVDDSSYSSNTYPLANLKKLYHTDSIFQRNKWNIGNDRTQTLILFSAEWNKNLVLVVHGDGNYGVKLLVYEMPSRSMSELLKVFNVSDGSYYNVSNANSRAYEVENNLKSANPIRYKSPYLYISYPYSNYAHLDSVFPNEVEKTTLYSGSVPAASYSDMPSKKNFLGSFASYNQTYKYNDVSHLLSSSYDNFLKYTSPDNIIKPLDIIKTSEKETVHTAIYLGNGKVTHKLKDGIRIDDWKDFGVAVGHPDTMTRYHPVIAFKNPEDIIKYIAELINQGDNFNIAYNNCEHFANKCVYGLDFSEHAEMKQAEKRSDYTKKPTSGYFYIPSDIRNHSGNYSWSKKSELEGYKAYHDEGISMEAEARIEVRPQSWYKMGD